MPRFTENGLIIENLATKVASLSDSYRGIYGDDIDISPDSPDGQRIAIEAKLIADIELAILDLANNQDPDLAIGQWLESKCKYAGITRKSPTNSSVDLIINTDRSLTLTTDFRVKDTAGNAWVLLNDKTLSTGSNTITFHAQESGEISSGIGTITIIDTPVLGVISVQHNSYVSVGVEEESDTQLRQRRNNSTQKPSLSTLGSIYANLYDLFGVKRIKIHNNESDSKDIDKDLDAHTLWVIVDGGVHENIIDTLMKTKSVGVGFKGNQSATYYENIDIGSGVVKVEHTIKYDRPMNTELYINVEVRNLLDAGDVDDSSIISALQNMSFDIDQDVVMSKLVKAIHDVNGDVSIRDIQVSRDNSNWESKTLTAGYDEIFSFADEAKISITVV